ncbi:hypothetical protein ACFVHS_42335 [Streptomyces sp. NPDC057746]|uniref:hypothetical protein n=1 Tax=Streptomyces sp. NPDC057746 TaxID=3346237 RepID=UPI00367FA926
MDWTAFVAALDDAADPVSLADTLFRELTQVELDLAQAVADAEEATQLRAVHRIRVPDTEPMAWPVLSRPDRYDIVLNLYDRHRFERMLKAGSISPHRHHFSFASVVLHGGFAHFVYANDGEVDEPILRPHLNEFVGRGGQLLLHWATYHCVLSPRPETVSLMVRSAPVAENPFTGDDTYTLEHLRSDRERLVEALRAAVSTQAAQDA